MVKVIAMMKRKPGISPDEFARYWYEEHKLLVMREQLVVQPPMANS